MYIYIHVYIHRYKYMGIVCIHTALNPLTTPHHPHTQTHTRTGTATATKEEGGKGEGEDEGVEAWGPMADARWPALVAAVRKVLNKQCMFVYERIYPYIYTNSPP